MSDLATDFYDDGVIAFLDKMGVTNARFIVAVDQNGRPYPFAGPGTKFRRIQDEGRQSEPSNGDCAWWCFENNPGVTAGVGVANGAGHDRLGRPDRDDQVTRR